ncbi:MAG: nitroreductase [Pseudomonadota bacterium]
MTAMSVTDAVRARKSIRAFTDTLINGSEIRTWLEAAQRSPSGGNVQPWRVIALAGDAKDAVIAKASETLARSPKGEPTDRPIYPEGLWGSYNDRRKRVGEMMYEALEIPKDNRAGRLAWFSNNFRFFNAPVALFFVIDTRMGHGQWAHMGMFMQSLALLAVERGWGTCMQECWGILRPSLKAHFALPDEDMVYCGMAVGHPDWEHPVNRFSSERATLDEFASFSGL